MRMTGQQMEPPGLGSKGFANAELLLSSKSLTHAGLFPPASVAQSLLRHFSILGDDHPGSLEAVQPCFARAKVWYGKAGGVLTGAGPP